jgi:hypothetical protein
MTSQNLKLVTNYTLPTKGYVDISEYKNDFEEIKNSDTMELIQAGLISLSDINKDAKHQIRAEDLDVGHSKKLQEQIEAKGLSKVPYVIWDAVLKMFIIISGHHRIEALVQIERDKGIAEEDILIPVVVLEFENEETRDFFIQKENTRHEPAKGASFKDAVLFLQNQYAKNYNNWQSLIKGNIKNFKKDVYDALKKADYNFYSNRKENVYKTAFEKELKIDVVKTITTTFANQQATARYNTKKFGEWCNNTNVIVSAEDPSTKVLKHVVRKRLKWAEANNRIGLVPKGSVKLISHIGKATGYESLQDKRMTHLETLERENKFLYNNPNLNFAVEEVSYLSQFKSGDGSFIEPQLRFFWDYNKMTFVDSKGNNYRQTLKAKQTKHITRKIKKNNKKNNTKKTTNSFLKQKKIYEQIISIVGLKPRKFPTKVVFFTKPEAEAIAKHINPSFDFKGKTVCGHEKSIFANSIPGWQKQDTTATHPNMPNLEKILLILS